jgi:hypothetical protein
MGAHRYLNSAMPILPKQTTRPIYIKQSNTLKYCIFYIGILPFQILIKRGFHSCLNSKQSNGSMLKIRWQRNILITSVKPVFKQPVGKQVPGKPYRPQMEMMEPQRPPPPGYTCFRCGEKGHYINMCPTIGDASFDNKPKIKRATGIPTMFLKTIQNKDAVDRGLMVTGEGDLVVAMPNE